MQTKEMILDAIKGLLDEKGLKEIRVRDICASCGISKPTFYAHFRDKYDAANTYYFQSILSNGIIYDMQCPYEERRLKLVQFYQKNAVSILHLLHEEGQDSLLEYIFQEVYPISSVDMARHFQFEITPENEYMLRGILSGQISCIRYWMENGCPFSAERMRDMLIAMEEGAILQFCKKVNK